MGVHHLSQAHHEVDFGTWVTEVESRTSSCSQRHSEALGTFLFHSSLLANPCQRTAFSPAFMYAYLQLGLELRGAQFVPRQAHFAEQLLGFGRVSGQAGLDFVLALLVFAATELVEMGWANHGQ
jgi:hypothetical protein